MKIVCLIRSLYAKVICACFDLETMEKLSKLNTFQEKKKTLSSTILFT